MGNIEIKVEEYENLKDIRRQLEKEAKWMNGGSVSVKIFDTFDDRGSNPMGQTYDVEISLYDADGEYQDSWVNQTFYGRFGDDEEALKQAKKRAKAVLKSVKGWYRYDEMIEVEDNVEIYHS